MAAQMANVLKGATRGFDSEDDEELDEEEEEKEQQQYLGLLLGMVLLTVLCVLTKMFTDQLYSLSNTGKNPIQDALFKVSMAISLVLFLVAVLASFRVFGEDSGRLGMSFLLFFSLWTGLVCAVWFGFMACSFPWICDFYDSRGFKLDTTELAHIGKRITTEPTTHAKVHWSKNVVDKWAFDSTGDLSAANGVMAFTHIECPKFFNENIPARVVSCFLGHFYALVALVVLGALKYIADKNAVLGGHPIPQSLGPVLASIMVDFVDLQDFFLLVLDDEVLKTFWNKADNGTGGSWLWVLIFAISMLAFLSMTGEAIYSFVFINREKEVCEALDINEEDTWNNGDSIITATSLVFIEVPFFVMRMFVALRFDVPPSSMILKNIFSIGKESWELFNQKRFTMGDVGGRLGAE